MLSYWISWERCSQHFGQWRFVCANIKRCRATTNAQAKFTVWHKLGHVAKRYWLSHWNDLRTKSRRREQSWNALYCEWRRSRSMHKRYTVQRIGTICCDWHLWNDETSQNHSDLRKYVAFSIFIPITQMNFSLNDNFNEFDFSFYSSKQLQRYRAYAATQFCHLLNETPFRIYRCRPKSKTICSITKAKWRDIKRWERERAIKMTRRSDKKSIGNRLKGLKWGTRLGLVRRDHRWMTRNKYKSNLLDKKGLL